MCYVIFWFYICRWFFTVTDFLFRSIQSMFPLFSIFSQYFRNSFGKDSAALANQIRTYRFFFFLLCLLLFSVSLLNRYRITANLLFILWIFCFDTMETIWLWQIYCVNNIFLEINLKYACVLNHYKQTINKNFTIGNYIGGSMSRNYTIKPILTNKELIK